MDAGEARYELVISVDARGSGQYSDAEKPLMRRQIYEVLETAFAQAGVGRNAVHLEDRGDGVLISVPGRIAVARLLGLWMTELHEKLRLDNRRERRPLGLRVAMHVGPDPHTRQQLQHLLTELLHHQRADTAGATRLAARLQDLPDRPLLTLLGAEDLPWASLGLLLSELGHSGRLRTRDDETAHALCTEVLRNNLYVRQNRRHASDSPSVAEMRERAGELFSWAVAPLVRDPRHTLDLGELLNLMVLEGRTTGQDQLRRILVSPPGGRAPDLPPQLWQQVVKGLLTPTPALAPSSPPPPPPPPLPAAYAPAPAPSTPPPPPPAPTPPSPSQQEGEREGSRFQLPEVSELIYQTWFIITVAALGLTAAVITLTAIVIN